MSLPVLLMLALLPAVFGKVGSEEKMGEFSQSSLSLSADNRSPTPWTEPTVTPTQVDDYSTNGPDEGAMTEADDERVYEVLGPGRYTALQGPLTVTVLRGSRHRSSATGARPPEWLQLSVRVLHASEELGGLTIGPVVEGVHFTASIPCGVVSRGGTHVVRLSKKDTILAEAIVLVRWPEVVVQPPRHGSPVTARFESKCRPVAGARPLTACAELLHYGAASPHPQMLPLQQSPQSVTSSQAPSQTVLPFLKTVLGGQIFPSEKRSQNDIREQDDTQVLPALQDKRNLISASMKSTNSDVLQGASSSSTDSNRIHGISYLEKFTPENSEIRTKFCEQPETSEVELNATAVVVERVKLAGLYSTGEADVWFDCRHLEDGEVYSARITVHLPASPVIGHSPNFMVQWSSMVSLNVSLRYMKECHGSVAVRVGQRVCRSSLNKIRVYAKVPFNVDSVNPPVEEKYVAEYRVKRLPINMPCSLFSEGPSEYCFVYVRVAASGAVAEVARACRPTLRPGVAVRHGVWSSWGSWGECVPSCGSGQQVRYRYCDSPPPLNKGAYCQGNATTVKPCSNPECDLHLSRTATPAPRLDVRFAACNCGCHVPLSSGSSVLLSADTSTCRGTASWFIKANDGKSVMLVLSRASLLASGQWMKVRDGNLSTSPVLLTLPTIPPHRTHGLFLQAHTLSVTNLTGAVEAKHWDKYEAQKSKSDPWWLIRSSAEWLRIEVHSFSNNSNKTEDHLGFTLLARPSGAEWPLPIEELLFSQEEQMKETSYVSVVNYVALFFIILILCLIVLFVVAFGIQYRLYRSSKMDTDSLCHSVGSSNDLDVHTPPDRFVSLLTIVEVLSMASFNFSRRDAPGNYTQLADRNCVPLRSKRTGCTSMPSSPFCGRAPLLRTKKLREHEGKRRSASCEELESRFIFPIKEENLLTTSVSEIEMSSSCKEDSGNDSPTKVSLKKVGKKSVIKKPQTIQGSFAYVTKVKNLTGSMLQKSNPHGNETLPKRSIRRKLSVKRSDYENKQSPSTKVTSITNVHSNSTSELSVNGADLEFDYYDYDMENASAVPGSLFGLDPTLMPWLPSILNIDEVNEDTDLYLAQRHPFSASESTLAHSATDLECIPLQDLSQRKPEVQEKTNARVQNADITASKAISLSNSDNSDEIRFADDSEEE